MRQPDLKEARINQHKEKRKNVSLPSVSLILY